MPARRRRIDQARGRGPARPAARHSPSEWRRGEAGPPGPPIRR